MCHAYQLLIKGGVKEENIVVFMYDDIANNKQNPRPGVIINHPQGPDVYAGVPKVIFFSLLIHFLFKLTNLIILVLHAYSLLIRSFKLSHFFEL